MLSQFLMFIFSVSAKERSNLAIKMRGIEIRHSFEKKNNNHSRNDKVTGVKGGTESAKSDNAIRVRS